VCDNEQTGCATSEKMPEMHARRLLFVRGPRHSGLAPILVALASLVALALAGLVIALWPPGPEPATYRPASGETRSGDRSLEGGLRVPAKPRDSPGRTRGI
jgi:hypothetical protein